MTDITPLSAIEIQRIRALVGEKTDKRWRVEYGVLNRSAVPRLLDELLLVRGLLDTAHEYARHSEGCSAAVGDYPCRCRWGEEQVAIRAYLDFVRGDGSCGRYCPGHGIVHQYCFGGDQP